MPASGRMSGRSRDSIAGRIAKRSWPPPVEWAATGSAASFWAEARMPGRCANGCRRRPASKASSASPSGGQIFGSRLWITGRKRSRAKRQWPRLRAGTRSLSASLKRRVRHEAGMNKAAIKLAPSILAADFARLGEQVAEAEQCGADRIHVDVMDGHFVPNLSMGAVVVQSIRPVTRLPLETHLMISDPDFFLDEFVAAGSDSFLVHWEGNNNLHRTVQRIRTLGKRAGVAINPATPASLLEEILPEVDQVLVMTVNPGFGGQ